MKASPHFDFKELGLDDFETAPPEVIASLRITAEGMEQIRSIVGRPFDVTSGYTPSERNDEIGRSKTTDHDNGLAVDGTFRGMTMYQVFVALRDAPVPAPVDQIIFYPYTTGHIHFGFGSRMRKMWLVRLKKANAVGKLYEPVAPKHIKNFPGYREANG